MPNAKRCILIVEDQTAERNALARVLRLEHYEVLTASNPTEALGVAGKPVDLVLTDLRMGGETGTDLLVAWRRRRPHTPFILMTAFGTIDCAVEAMKLGANDFLAKPVDPVHLLERIDLILSRDGDGQTEDPVSTRINAKLAPNKIVGRSRALLETCAQTLRAAEASSTVLILGESGTGKELIAEALHRHSARHAGPFVVVNMAAIPETLVESDLFGHIKGAFTNASGNRIGRFEASNGGTLFVDEIGDFPLQVQAKLLRVLETRTINPVGSNRIVPVDVRVVAATSRPLTKMIERGEFREDLYYRLNVITIQLPPLRLRRQDISLLTATFLQEFAVKAGRPAPQVAPALMRELERLDWPGNIRQLRNCLERMYVLRRTEVLTIEDLPPDLRDAIDAPSRETGGSSLESVKRTAMLDALDQFDGNRTRAAAFLGISVRTLQRKLHDWGMAGTTPEE